MPTKNPYSDQRREQHPATIVPNPPAPTVQQALSNAQKQVKATK
jgi:hypothetical protein